MRRVWNRILLYLFLVNIMFAVQLNMVSSLQPLFIESLGANPLEIGVVISIQGLVSTLLMIPSGFLMERLGGKRMLLTSACSAVSSLLLYAVSASWEALVPWTILYGTVFSTFIITRHTLLANHSSNKNRATIYGIMNMSWSFGGIIGPLIAGTIADGYGWSPLFITTALVAGVAIIPILLLYENSPSQPWIERHAPETRVTRLDRKSFNIILLISLSQFAIGTSMGVIGPVIPLYLSEIYGASNTEVGLFLSLGVGVVTLFTQIPSGLIADRYGNRRVMLICGLVTPLLFVALPWSKDYVLVLLLFMSINAAWSMTWAASIAPVVNNVLPSKRSLAIGIRQMAIRLGSTLGPFLGGYFWHLYQVDALISAVPFYVSAVFFGLSVVPIFLLQEQ